MSEKKPRRGRPKGSGIDDSARLRSIAALMVADPGLKPTTAIKRIGVNDPSIIRRLRDKFHVCKAQLMAELHGSSQTPAICHSATANRTKPAGAIENVQRQSVSTKLVASTAAVACSVADRDVSVKYSDAAGEAAAATPAPAKVRKSASTPMGELQRQDVETWIATMCGLSLQAISQAFETQLTLLAQFVRLPQVALAMRQQVAFNDYALALSDTGPRSRPH